MRRRRRFLFGLAAVLVGVLAWGLLRPLGLVSPELLASPGEVWAALTEILRDGYRGTTLAENIGATLGRCLAGFALATVLGVPLGLWLGMSRLADASVNFIIQFLRPLPPLSYLVLLILWFGAGDLSKIMLLFMGAFPSITTAAMAGVRQVSRQRMQVARTLGASSPQIFWFVVLPGALSMIFTGLSIALAGAFSSVVAAELMAASDGLGWMIFSASRFLRNDIIMLGIILLGVFGMALTWSLALIDRRVVHWRGRD